MLFENILKKMVSSVPSFHHRKDMWGSSNTNLEEKRSMNFLTIGFNK